MATGAQGAGLKGDERESYVGTLFDKIAPPYDRLNRILSLGRDLSWRRTALDHCQLRPGDTAVDLGCGTGDFFCELRHRLGTDGTVVGIDLSQGMLKIARTKALAAGHEDPDLRQGNARATGLPDAKHDLVTMGWVLRNVGNREEAYREILRILKPGGTFCCLDMGHPQNFFTKSASLIYSKIVMPLVVRLLGADVEAYRYLQESTARFPDRRALAAEIETAGFVAVEHRSFMLGNIACLWAKRPTN
ncbi:MAG: ubiquinone/menaquinone biosynthesis methyltransferase [Planctomycetota bacterium]